MAMHPHWAQFVGNTFGLYNNNATPGDVGPGHTQSKRRMPDQESEAMHIVQDRKRRQNSA